MKNFLFKLALFICIIVALDFSFGKLCYYLFSTSKGGETRSLFLEAEEIHSDLIIMGSSRALHHYSSSILEDSLHISVYNCGHDGDGIIFQYGLFKLLTQRYTPKYIIYDVIPNFDIWENDNTKYLNGLKPFYYDSNIRVLFKDILSPLDNLKMVSKMYRYNWSFITILKDNVSVKNSDYEKGFIPLYGQMQYEPQERQKHPLIWDQTKKEYFEKLLRECKNKNIKLIFALSPFYKGKDITEFEPIIQFAEKNNIPLLNYFDNSLLSTNKKYFKDSHHLNADGAQLYTSDFSQNIKNYLKQ